jgi:hypothetical protein
MVVSEAELEESSPQAVNIIKPNAASARGSFSFETPFIYLC